MAVPATVRELLAAGDLAGIDDEWLTRLAVDPEDLGFFAPVARALAEAGEETRARSLLELVDDELRERGDWRARLDLLRRVGDLLAPPTELHGEILGTLSRLHADRPSLDALVEKVGLRRAIEDIRKTWDKVDRLEELVSRDLGTIVWMEGKGVGRVVEVNLELETFKVDFEAHRGLAVGFRGTAKLLLPLPPGHLLRRKLEDPDGLRAIRDRDPAELLRLTLESWERPLTAAEIREALRGVVEEDGWSAWWAVARRHPQVMVSPAGRQAYSWAASGDAAAAAVLRAFDAAAGHEKIEIFRKNAGRDAAFAERLAQTLGGAAESWAARGEPALAFEAWGALERADLAPPGAPWAPEHLVAAADEPAALVTGLADRALRERAIGLVRDLRADWAAVYQRLLGREGDPRILDRLAEALGERDPEVLARFVEEALSQPRKRPAAFVWLAERAAREPELAARNPLRLLQLVLASLAAEGLQPYRTRLRALFEPGGTVPRLLPLLDDKQALQARDAVTRTGALDAYQRTALINALELRFPSLRREAEQPLYATSESITARRAELRQLLEVEIPANRKAIEEARALGDLRENFEYKSARQRHEYLSARVQVLQHDLARARPLPPGGEGALERVRIGARVELESTGGRFRTLTILGPWESQPEAGIVSYESDLAQSLLGAEVGDQVVVEGEALIVARIDPWTGQPAP